MFTTLLLIIFTVILVCWLIVRIVLMRFVSRNRNAQYPQARERRGRNDGDVYVSKDETDDDKKVVEKDMGEYVDYEPVKEDKKDGNI